MIPTSFANSRGTRLALATFVALPPAHSEAFQSVSFDIGAAPTASSSGTHHGTGPWHCLVWSCCCPPGNTQLGNRAAPFRCRAAAAGRGCGGGGSHAARRGDAAAREDDLEAGLALRPSVWTATPPRWKAWPATSDGFPARRSRRTEATGPVRSIHYREAKAVAIFASTA